MDTERPAIAAPRRRPGGPRRSLALVVGLLALFVQSAPAPARAAQTWTTNLYTSRAFLYQDPYSTACTAAATMIMLNTIAYRHTGGATFRWTPTRVKNDPNRTNYHDMISILMYERAHDTLSVYGSGSDGHGWRNALNAYGWGSTAMTDPTKMVYDDLEFTSYDSAVHAAVRAIARYQMPVGILTWAGRHAQVMTGFVVDGDDPRISDSFTVRYVYLSDPLYGDHLVNTKVSNATFKSGSWQVRFQLYRETDSPYDDVYKPGWKRSSVAPSRGTSEWYHRWVIVAPIRAMVPLVLPDPTPDPTPTPTPTPTPDPTPTPAPSAQPDAQPATSDAPVASDAPPASDAPATPSASDAPAASDAPSLAP